MEKKLIAIGLDGGSYKLVKRWIEERKLPALKKVAEQGFFCELESCMPPITAPANATIITGVNPAKHSVFDFIEPNPRAELKLVNATSIKSPSLWKILSQNGKRCCIINMPMTYPPEKINGVIISGLLSPSVESAFMPKHILKELKEAGIDYQIGEDYALSGNEKTVIKYYSQVFKEREKTAKFLLQKEDWDFFLIYFRVTDIISHFFWKHMDKSHPLHKKKFEKYSDTVYSFYKRIDNFVSWVLRKYPQRTIIVFSDHGFCPLYGVINLNIYFKEKRLLFLKNTPKTLVKRFFFALGFTPKNVYSFLRKTPLLKLVSKKSLEEKEKGVEHFLSYADIDWNKTVAYSRGHIGQVYLTVNKKDKEAYRKAMERTISVLKELKTPNGKKLKVEVIEGSKVHKSRFAERAPDLYVVIEDFKYICFPLFASSNKIFDVQIEGNSANHDRSGILLGAGPGIKKRAVKKASLVDFAPCVLAFFGFKPEGMDGCVLPPFRRKIRKPIIKTKKHRKKLQFTPQEKKKLEKRLKGLGYL